MNHQTDAISFDNTLACVIAGFFFKFSVTWDDNSHTLFKKDSFFLTRFDNYIFITLWMLLLAHFHWKDELHIPLNRWDFQYISTQQSGTKINLIIVNELMSENSSMLLLALALLLQTCNILLYDIYVQFYPLLSF